MLEDDNAGAVWFLILELGNLIGDFLLSCGRSIVSACLCHWREECLTVSAGLDGSFDVADTLDCHAVLVVAVNHLVLKLANLVDQDTKLIGNIRDIIVTCFTPN